jgi:hypothetical protein
MSIRKEMALTGSCTWSSKEAEAQVWGRRGASGSCGVFGGCPLSGSCWRPQLVQYGCVWRTGAPQCQQATRTGSAWVVGIPHFILPAGSRHR